MRSDSFDAQCAVAGAKPPCPDFKAFRTYARVFCGAAMTFATYMWWRLDRIESRFVERNEALVEMQTDMKYMRVDIAEIKAALRLRTTHME